MNVLIIGAGGREHALAWKAAHSPLTEHIFVAPGNAGTAMEPKISNVDIGADQIDRLVEFARENGVGLTIVGPEVPLVLGVVDALSGPDLTVSGPPGMPHSLKAPKPSPRTF